MATKLYVGNLSYSTTDAQLKETFSAVGEVAEAVVLMDKQTGRSRGFGFVTMANDADAQRAIDEMNGKEVDGRKLVVNEARPRTDAAPRSGGYSRDY